MNEKFRTTPIDQLKKFDRKNFEPRSKPQNFEFECWTQDGSPVTGLNRTKSRTKFLDNGSAVKNGPKLKKKGRTGKFEKFSEISCIF